MGGPLPSETTSPPPPPPSPTWTPPASPAMMRNLDTWSPLLSSLAKMIGIALIFAGTLVIVIGGAVPSNCITSAGSCSVTGTAGNILNAMLTARILWTIGLAGLAFGAGMKLRSGSKSPASMTTAEALLIAGDRSRNGMILAVAVVSMIAVGLPFLFPFVTTGA